MKNKIIYPNDIIRGYQDDVIGVEGEDNKWQFCNGVYGAQSGTVLEAAANISLCPLKIDLDVKGWHEITITIFPLRGNRFTSPIPDDVPGLFVRLDENEPYTTLYTIHDQAIPQELYYGCTDLTDRKLEITNFGHPIRIDCITLKPLSTSAVAAYQKSMGGDAEKEVAGINDFNDVVDHHFPAGQEAQACIQAHAEAGFTTVYHKCYAVRCEYHSHVEEVALPKGKPVGRLLTQYDPLPIAVETAHQQGVKILGWMRISNEFGGAPTSEQVRLHPDFYTFPKFHKKNPDKVMEHKDGSLSAKISIVYPEVREHKIAIATEILEYGVDGLMIDTLRHPPMVMWERPVAEEFHKQFDQDPRKMPGDGSEEWIRFRASYFTRYLRDLRKAMDAHKPGLELAVRTVPETWRALRDGCDIDAWINERLIDTLILSPHGSSPGTIPETVDIEQIRNRTANRMKLLVNIWRYGEFATAEKLARQAYNQGADGVVFYESDYLVLNPERRKKLRKFRNASLLE